MISLPMALRLSSSKRRRRCLAGFEPRMRRSACSTTSHGMPDMSEGYHAKTSRLVHRKSASSCSYLARSWVSIRTVLVWSVGLTPTALVRSVGLLQSGTTGIDDSLSRESSAELMTEVASS